jgi:hypothetical protein
MTFHSYNLVSFAIIVASQLHVSYETSINRTLGSITLVIPVANVIKLFQRNYVAIGLLSVKNIGKYAASGVNYAFKKFYNIGHSH